MFRIDLQNDNRGSYTLATKENKQFEEYYKVSWECGFFEAFAIKNISSEIHPRSAHSDLKIVKFGVSSLRGEEGVPGGLK